MSGHLTKLLAMIFVFSAVLTRLPAQSANGTTTQESVVLTKLFQPVYPPLARQTRIVGDVELQLEVRADGSVESVNVVSGHPLLKQAAVDSAKQSRFECQRCGEGKLPYHLVYSFQLVAENCCTAVETNTNAQNQDQPIPRVIQSVNHVTVVDGPACICDPAADTVKVRSVKCLYLWRCAVR